MSAAPSPPTPSPSGGGAVGHAGSRLAIELAAGRGAPQWGRGRRAGGFALGEAGRWGVAGGRLKPRLRATLRYATKPAYAGWRSANVEYKASKFRGGEIWNCWRVSLLRGQQPCAVSGLFSLFSPGRRGFPNRGQQARLPHGFSFVGGITLAACEHVCPTASPPVGERVGREGHSTAENRRCL